VAGVSAGTVEFVHFNQVQPHAPAFATTKLDSPLAGYVKMNTHFPLRDAM
jgi:hypothetical protein